MAKALCVLPFLVVFFAGFGRDSPAAAERLSKGEYLEGIRTIEQDAGEAVALFTNLVSEPLPQEECARQAREFHVELEAIIAEVEALAPPEEIENLQEEFLAAARESVDSVGEAAGEVEEGTLACGEPYNERVYGLPSTRRAEEVLERLREKGYLLGLNSGA